MSPRAIVAVIAALMVFAFGSAAFAQTDCKALMPPSPWGPNDQTGATNRVTPAVTKAAAPGARVTAVRIVFVKRLPKSGTPSVSG